VQQGADDLIGVRELEQRPSQAVLRRQEPMVDYGPFLTRAIATLNPNNTGERRQALYDRARRALVDKLRKSNPTLSEADLRAERLSLEAAIRRVEADALSLAAAPAAKPAHGKYPEYGEEYQDRPPLKDDRKSLLRIIAAGVFGVALITFAGIAGYSFWTHMHSSRSTTLNPGNVTSIAEQPNNNTSYVYLRQPVFYRTNHPVGTIIVDKTQGFLYVVRPNLAALRYGISIDSQCHPAAGLYQVVRKEEWPGWKPLSADLSDSDNDRIKNPLGARALYLNNDYLIHGSNGTRVSDRRVPKGCIRLINEDIIYLHGRTPLDSRVVVMN